MIVFDLRCATGHVFEAWFASGRAYDDQRAAGQLACPLCGNGAVEKAAMAPAVPAKSNAASAKRALAELAAAQARALDGSQWVGATFAERARAIHAGDEPDARIHGQATLADAKALIDDGIPVAPLPLPVVPPERRN